MVFELFSIKIKIGYSFILVIALSLISDNNSLLYLLLFSAFHEAGHLLTLLAFGGKPYELSFEFYGIGLKHKSSLTPIKEVIFLLSGPAVNLAFTAMNIHSEINFPLFIINLLPLYPLDGGRSLKLILNNFFSLKISDNIFKVITVIFTILLCLSALYFRNLSLLLIDVYIIVYAINNSFD